MIFDRSISVDRILLFHHEAVAREGEKTERPSDQICVEKCLAGAKQGAYYLAENPDEDEPNPLHFAGCLLYYLAKDHCFVDGTKRTAWMATVELLLLQGLEIKATEDEAVALVHNVIENQVDRDGVIEWLGEPGRLVDCDPPETSPSI